MLLRLIPTLGQVPSRVISLDPMVTYTLSKMGKNAHLAGQTSGVEQLPGLDAIPLMGPPDAPQIQSILATKPDIIIANPTHHAALTPALQQGIPVLWLDTATLAEAVANIRCLGVLMQLQDKAEKIISENAEQLHIVRHKLAGLPQDVRPRTVQVLAVDGNSCLVPETGNIVNERLCLAGAVPLHFPKGIPAAGGVVRVSAQDVRAFRPQYVCIGSDQENAFKALLETPEWAGILPEILTFPGIYVKNPGIEYGMFTLWLANSLHPQVMGQQETQLQKDVIVSQRPLSLPFTYVRCAQVNQERVFDMSAKTLQIDFAHGQRVLSSLHGLQTDVRGIGNHHTPTVSWPLTHYLGMDAVNARLFRILAPDGPPPLLLHTGADVDNFVFAEARGDGLHAGVVVTAGVTANALRAGVDSGTFVEHGTINIIAMTNRKLTDAAMVQALIILTEAKTAALQALDIRSTVSGLAATGTGTDAIMVVAGEGAPITMAGGHTKMGELLGQAARQAVCKAIALQDGLTSRRTVCRRLAEHGVNLMPAGANLAHEDAARIAHTVESLLQEPYYAGFMATALALADSESDRLLPDTQAFRAWCLDVASRVRGSRVTQLPNIYGGNMPESLSMTCNALAAGACSQTF